VVNDRQAGVAVHVGVPVPGEVLGHRDLAGLVEPVHRGGGHGGHQGRVRAEGTDPDHRVGWVHVDVGDRGVVQVDAERPHGRPGGLALGPDEGRVTGGPGGHLAGEDCGHPGEPGYDPALLIRADQQREMGRLAVRARRAPGRRRAARRILIAERSYSPFIVLLS
jgi:hypothetical protein